MTPRDAQGQLIARGLVGGTVDIELAGRAAAQAARNALAAVVGAAGGLDRVEQCLRMSVFVACVDGFEDLSAVADAASDELESHLGPGRRPARSAIGVRALPGGAPIEIELTAVVRAPRTAVAADRPAAP
jgi:enamine deaminase RidA (YjgF/YER057c/UK114 family)